MANILISLFSGIKDENNENAIPCFYETIISKLQEYGHNVHVYISRRFNMNFKILPENIKRDIISFNPDLCIFFNNTFYDISNIVSCPIVVYEVDSSLYYSNKESLKKNINRFKFIVSQDISMDCLIGEYGAERKNIAKIPFFTEIKAENVPSSNNICFIGTKFGNEDLYSTPYHRFIAQKPTIEEKRIYLKLLSEIEKNPLVTVDAFWKKHSEVPSKVKDFFSIKDIICYISDFNRKSVLSSIAEFGLDLFGTAKWENCEYNHPELMLNYINRPVYSLKHNQDIYNSCKVGININHLQAVSGFSWRVCDIMASNACLVSEYKPDIEKYFGSVIPTFKSPFDARGLCAEILENENKRLDIVSASQEIINKKFRFKNVLPLIEELIGFDLYSENKNLCEVSYFSIGDKQEAAKQKVAQLKTVGSETLQDKRKIPFRTKIYYKIWKHLNKKLKKKGIIC